MRIAPEIDPMIHASADDAIQHLERENRKLRQRIKDLQGPLQGPPHEPPHDGEQTTGWPQGYAECSGSNAANCCERESARDTLRRHAGRLRQRAEDLERLAGALPAELHPQAEEALVAVLQKAMRS